MQQKKSSLHTNQKTLKDVPEQNEDEEVRNSKTISQLEMVRTGFFDPNKSNETTRELHVKNSKSQSDEAIVQQQPDKLSQQRADSLLENNIVVEYDENMEKFSSPLQNKTLTLEDTQRTSKKINVENQLE